MGPRDAGPTAQENSMKVFATPMRVQGRPRDKREIEAAVPVVGDMTIYQTHSEQYGRWSKVASFHTSGAADQQPLPPLHDVELSWMGPNGFVLTGIEFVGNVAYGQSWYCRTSA